MPDSVTTTIDQQGDETAVAGTAAEAGEQEDLAGVEGAPSAPHRLRDLDRRGRLWAAAFALALLLAPLQAFAHSVSDWVPSIDVARMGIQSLEVGTSSTPLTGQPSTSAEYVEVVDDRHVDHLGPLHYYLMAGPMRLFGPTVGMLSVSAALVAASAWLSAWAVFRRLGPAAGAVAAVLIGLIMFTTGASSLMNPVSSNIAGYPVFCVAVLSWCVLRGDLRLLPLTIGVAAFAAQIHLSVLPTVAVLVLAALVGLLWCWGGEGRWREAAARRQLGAWTGGAAAVGLVMWSPMLLQEATEDPGNLTNLVWLTTAEDRPTLGPSAAVNALVNALGLPSLLGRTDLHGNSGVELLRSPSPTTWLAATFVTSLVVLLAVRWQRSGPGSREKAGLVLIVGVLALCGAVNTSSVLESIEAWRLVFYHWVFPLLFFLCLVLALGAIEAFRAFAASWSRPEVASRVRPAAAGAGVASMGALAVVNPVLDRPTNDVIDFGAVIERRYVDDALDQVLDHREQLDGPVVVLDQGGGAFNALQDPVALYLGDEGVDARLPARMEYYVADDRLAEDDIETGLLVVHDHGTDWADVGVGELMADVVTVTEADIEIYEEALEVFEDVDELQFGPSLRSRFDRAPEGWVEAAEAGRLSSAGLGAQEMADHYDDYVDLMALSDLVNEPSRALASPGVLDTLLDDPLIEPRVDEGLLRQLRRSTIGDSPAERPTRIRVYLLDEDGLAELGFPDNSFL